LVTLTARVNIFNSAFIFTPEQIDASKNNYKNDNCVQFMIESLKDLDKQLEGRVVNHPNHPTLEVGWF